MKSEPRKILIVEDNPYIVELMSMVLERESNWETTAVTTGMNAVEAWLEGDYDLILMDLRMPLMSGFDAARKIKELEKQLNRKHTPLIACSALVDRAHQQKCFESGFDDFIEKPIAINHVLETLYRYIGRGSASPKAASSQHRLA